MRDIATVSRGERVGVWQGHIRLGWGEFQGVDDNRVVVLMPDGSIMSTELGSSWFSVMDGAGRELGVPIDGALVGEPPELE